VALLSTSAAALTLPPLAFDQAWSAASSSLARQVALVGTAALLAAGPSVDVLAADAPPCRLECFRECNTVAPGNKEYCSKQCDSYCEEVANPQTDILRSDPSEAAPAAAVALGSQKDCKASYKTKAAIEYCEGQNEQAKMTAVRSKDLGIFGDSGVSYSSGVEDLFATAFGAKRQNKPVGEADFGGFASEVGEAAISAVLGKK